MASKLWIFLSKEEALTLNLFNCWFEVDCELRKSGPLINKKNKNNQTTTTADLTYPIVFDFSISFFVFFLSLSVWKCISVRLTWIHKTFFSQHSSFTFFISPPLQSHCNLELQKLNNKWSLFWPFLCNINGNRRRDGPWSGSENWKQERHVTIEFCRENGGIWHKNQRMERNEWRADRWNGGLVTGKQLPPASLTIHPDASWSNINKIFAELFFQTAKASAEFLKPNHCALTLHLPINSDCSFLNAYHGILSSLPIHKLYMQSKCPVLNTCQFPI